MLLTLAGIMMGREDDLLSLEGGVLVTPIFHISIDFPQSDAINNSLFSFSLLIDERRDGVWRNQKPHFNN